MGQTEATNYETIEWSTKLEPNKWYIGFISDYSQPYSTRKLVKFKVKRRIAYGDNHQESEAPQTRRLVTQVVESANGSFLLFRSAYLLHIPANPLWDGKRSRYEIESFDKLGELTKRLSPKNPADYDVLEQLGELSHLAQEL